MLLAALANGRLQPGKTILDFYDPHLTPESIAENYAKVESIDGFSEPGPFALGGT
jgi:hypothetical protein